MFKIVWDKEYNGVRLTMSSAGEALNIAPRPVFSEELDFLGMSKYGWRYPRTEAPLLWACERRYFYKGEVVMEVKGGNLLDKFMVSVVDEAKNLHIEPVDIERLRKKNEDTLFILEHEAMNFINDTYRRYKGLAEATKKNPDADFQVLAALQTKKTKEEHVVIKESCDSFDIMPLSLAEMEGKVPILTSKIEMFISSYSGGKDSQVVLDLVTRVIPPEDFKVFYSDTGYELPSSLELYEEVEKFYKKNYPSLEFYTTKNHQEVLYYWDEMDSPSRVHRWCCAVMKTAPLYRKLKELHGTGKQPFVMAFEGVRAEESDKRAQYSKIGKDVKHNNVLNVRPIFEWNQTEVWLYILLHGLPYNDAYRRGLNRVGCVLCPMSSEFGDCLDYRLYPEAAQPFVDKLREMTVKAGIRNVDEYLKERKWKVRAGGDRHITSSQVEFLSSTPDFKAKVTHPKENILEWMKVLGKYSYVRIGNVIQGDVRYEHEIFQITLNFDTESDSFTIEVKNTLDKSLFVSHLKRVLQKVTHCAHCEVCEVECPTGALSVVPRVSINDAKCIKCHKCLDFIDNGCETANSIRTTQGNKKLRNMNKTTINKYNTFGLRGAWVKTFMENHDVYYENQGFGINVKKQLPIFLNWMRDAGVINYGERTLSTVGQLLVDAYRVNIIPVWEIMWINLCNNTDICSWYINTVDFTRSYTRDELDASFSDEFPEYVSTVRENSMKAFQNTFKESPLGEEIPIGIISKSGNKVSFSRMPYAEVSLVAVAYSMFKYAEKVGRKSLTVSEFYNEAQQDGIYRQFGLSKETLERKLRSIQEEQNHVLSVELNMGLDNIILREDLNSTDILKMML
ncbi:MAG: DUF4007 family protein [Paludibacteraceae bacterium]|nr:DUF4007 family protein [Paludibacteraceae bacterium]